MSQSIQNWNELWMKSGGVLDPGWHTLYEPRVLSPACPRCTIYALYVAYWAYCQSSALTCARHIVPRCCGACEMGWWARSHNALSLPLYSHSPDSVGRNQAIVDTSLWPRGARSDVLVSTHRSTSNLLLRYFLVAPGLRSQKRIEWVKDTHRYNKSSHKMAIACIILQG